MIVTVLGVVTIAAGLRAATLRADLPYMTYYDEPWALMGSARQIAGSTWDPGDGAATAATKTRSYLYPALVSDATTVGALALSVVRGDTATLSEGARATVASPYAEIVEPRDLVLAGRLAVFAHAIAMVILVALLGSRLAGRLVGVLAALFVALLPVFVTRGSIVIVDTPAACYATAALYCTARVVSARWKRPLVGWAVLGGVASALAFTSKYSAGSVLLAVFAVVALRSDRSLRQRLGTGLAVGAAFVVAAVLVMPALVVRTTDVIDVLQFQARVYNRFPASASYWQQLLRNTEFGPLALFAALIGLAVLLRSRRARPIVIAFFAFAIPMLATLMTTAYQPMRNILPLMPFLAVASAAAVAELVRFVGTLLRTHRLVQAVAAVVIVLAFSWIPLQSTRRYIDDKRRTTDTRITVQRWLSEHVHPGEKVLVARELSFLDTELRGICAHVVVGSQREQARLDRYDWVIVGDLDRERFASPWWDALAPRRETTSIGVIPTSGEPGNEAPLENVWHANAELIHAFGPDDAPTRRLRRGPCPAGEQSLRDVKDIGPDRTSPNGRTSEGDEGTREMPVTVSLSRPADEPVSIRWRTLYRDSPRASDAKPNIDYIPASGTVVVAPGATTATAVITIKGDRIPEANESVYVAFTPSSTSVTVEGLYGLGRGVIVDDD